MGFLNDFLSATPQRDTLLSNGSYNKKTWIDQEIIREGDLNTLEDIAYKNRQSIINDESEILALTSRVSTVEDTANKQTTAILELENEVKQITEEAKGNYITINGSQDGYIQDIELFGNTIQSLSNLADIRSSGTIRDDGLYDISLISCGKNLFDKSKTIKAKSVVTTNGNIIDSPDFYCSLPIRVKKAKYVKSTNNAYAIYNSNGAYVSGGYSETIDVPADGFIIISIPLANINTFQLEEGTVATQYEPYICNRASVVLPCQLEKIGDKSDRLFKREDGVWCIEKNIFTKYLKECEVGNYNNFACRFYLVTLADNEHNYTDVKFLTNLNYTHTNINHQWLNRGYNSIAINNSTINGVLNCTCDITMESYNYQTVIDMVNGENVWVKYILKTSQIIELPLDAQIQLNSFDGVTNIFTEDMDMWPTIKCITPKSLGASVKFLQNNASTLSNRLEKIETLQEGNELKVITNNHYATIEDTIGGYLKDFTIKGKTLMNVMDVPYNETTTSLYKSENVNGYHKITMLADGDLSFQMCVTNTLKMFKPNIYYTFIVDVKTNTLNSTEGLRCNTSAKCILTNNGESNINVVFTKVGGTGVFVNKYKTEPHFTKNNFDLKMSSCKSGGILEYKMYAIEGDYTQNPPSYFEGLKSVGEEVDNIVISSNNVNLFDGKLELGGISSSTGVDEISSSHSRTPMIEVGMNKQFSLSGASGLVWVMVVEYDAQGNRIGNILSKKPTLQDSFQTTSGGFIRIRFDGVPNIISTYNIQIEEGTVATHYQPYKGNKKQILYQTKEGVYEKPVLRSTGSVSDTIEKHNDGKYYFHKRCSEFMLDGSESWALAGTQLENTLTVWKDFEGKKGSAILTDKLVSNVSYSDYDNNSIHSLLTGSNLRLAIRVQKASLSTAQDVQEFKTWLSKNPTTVIYELNAEEVYKCVDLDLESYEGQTNVMIYSGAINSAVSCKVTSHIGNVISHLREDVTLNNKFREDLTESITLYKESDNGYLVAEDTKDGYINDLMIEGTTLVNLATTKTGGFEFSSGSSKQIYTGLRKTLAPGKYTLFTNITENTLDKGVIISFSTPSSGIQYPGIGFAQGATGIQMKLLTISMDVTNIRLYTDNTTTGKVSFDNIMILEGDYAQNPPTYFDNLKSVGDGADTIEVSSKKEDGNLWNANNVHLGEIESTTGEIKNDANGVLLSKKLIQVKPNSTVYGYADDGSGIVSNPTIYCFDINKKLIGTRGNGGTLPSNCFYVRLRLSKTGFVVFDKSKLFAYFGYSPYQFDNISYKEDRKLVLYQDKEGNYKKPILRSVGNTKDTIKKHSDGKYYFHKRCDEIIFDGSSDETWSRSGTGTYSGTLSNGHYITVENIKTVVSSTTVAVVSSTLQGVSSQYGSVDGNVGIFTSNGNARIYIRTLNSVTDSLETFKTWLSTNPTTIVYELAIEEVYEMVNLDLNSYDGTTSITFDGGPISPKISLKVTSRLANTIQVLKDKVHYLEDKVINMFKAVLSGNVQTLAYELYPEDFEKQDILQEQTDENI